MKQYKPTGFLAALACLLMLAACNPNRVYRQYVEITDGIWSRDTKANFIVKLEEPLPSATVWVGVRYAEPYMFDDLKLRITATDPSGQREVDEFDMKIKDVRGEYRGSGAGQLFDLEEVFKSDYPFPTSGRYEFQIEHLMDDDLLPLVLEVGLLVDKNEQGAK